MTKLARFALPALALITIAEFQQVVKSQVTLPDIVTGDVIEGIKGTTVNRSVQGGNKSAVSFGSSTTFGASSSLNLTSGATGYSESFLELNPTGASTGDTACPTGGCVSSSVGGADGITNADITNVRSTTDSNQDSSGAVNLTGIQAANTLVIDGEKSTFQARLQTVESANYLIDSNGDFVVDNEGNLINNAANITGESQNANASSNTIINTNTNVDINTTEFVSTFQQAF